MATFLRNGPLERCGVDQGHVRRLRITGNVDTLGIAILELYLSRPHHDHRLASLGSLASQEAGSLDRRKSASTHNGSSPKGQRGRSSMSSQAYLICHTHSGARCSGGQCHGRHCFASNPRPLVHVYRIKRIQPVHLFPVLERRSLENKKRSFHNPLLFFPLGTDRSF